MHVQQWEFKQTVPDTTWEIRNIPEGASNPVISHVITSEGRVIEPEGQAIAPYGLELSFGVTPVSGTAYGTYVVGKQEEEEHVVSNTTGGNVYVTQYNYPKD